MKTTKRMISILALMLALVMCFSACGDKETSSKGKGDASSVTDSAQTDISSDDTNATDSETESTDASDKEEAGSSSKKNPASNTSKKPTVQNSKSKVWADDYLSTMPEDAKKKGVRILMWRPMLPTEQKMLEAFEKKTGCDVTVIETSEAEYLTKLVSLIGANEAPDIASVIGDRFPGTVVRAMQPLNPTTFRLDDNIWNKQYMNEYKIGNYYFGVAISGSWNCDDCAYVTYYQPSVLKNCGIPEAEQPYQLYKEGKWNWNTQYNVASKVSAAGKIGLSMITFDMFMLSSGNDFITYKDSKFVDNMQSSSDMINKSWQEVCKINTGTLSSPWKLDEFLKGNVGMFTSIAYGIYNESDWKLNQIPGGPESIACVPVAGPAGQQAYTPYRAKTWGTPKAAKNKEGAAYFLRYWLDPSNCDMKSTILNDQAYSVFKEITSPNHKRMAQTACGVMNLATPNSYYEFINKLRDTSSNNVTQVLDSQKGAVANAVNRANKDLSRFTK